MVKLLILIIIVFILFAVENEQVKRCKTPTGYTQGIKVAHIVCGVLVVAFATVHGAGHLLRGAGTASLITGIITLALLYAEVACGVYLNSKKGNAAPAARTTHKFLPIAMACLLMAHVLVRALA